MKGRAEGEAIGIVKGRAEGEARKEAEILKKMQIAGLSEDMIRVIMGDPQ